eukprot:TRINITY_DN647_c0_g2_i2.p1 TRINITY_DN647_c0_g2~~TRINITY_DN647_c0_g2_i2.p1  ORF type:complete len:153 (-),score=6.00 TRINITY_DN647_c0_g2_i2:356-814(-)
MSAAAEAALAELCNRVGGGKRHFEQILQHLRETDSRTAGDLERQLGIVLMEDAEAGDCEDDFPCPGCEDDFDLPSLCSHMEEEHPELLEEEVDCPVCGRLVRKDVVGHMLSEHVQFSRISSPSATSVLHCEGSCLWGVTCSQSLFPVSFGIS